MHAIREALNATGKVRVVRNQVGVDLTVGVRYGLGIGSPDLIGVTRSGHVFAVEVKTQNGRVRPEQAAWWRAAQRWGVRGGIARSVEEALSLLAEAIQ